MLINKSNMSWSVQTFFQTLALISAIFWPQMVQLRLLFLYYFSDHHCRGGIRTHVSKVAPVCDLWRTLYRLSYNATAERANISKTPILHAAVNYFCSHFLIQSTSSFFFFFWKIIPISDPSRSSSNMGSLESNTCPFGSSHRDQIDRYSMPPACTWHSDWY